MCNATLMQIDGQLVLRILSEITLVDSFYDLSVLFPLSIAGMNTVWMSQLKCTVNVKKAFLFETHQYIAEETGSWVHQ